MVITEIKNENKVLFIEQVNTKHINMLIVSGILSNNHR